MMKNGSGAARIEGKLLRVAWENFLGMMKKSYILFVVVLQVLMHVVKFYKTHGPRIHVKTGEFGKGLQFSSWQ